MRDVCRVADFPCMQHHILADGHVGQSINMVAGRIGDNCYGGGGVGGGAGGGAAGGGGGVCAVKSGRRVLSAVYFRQVPHREFDRNNRHLRCV